MAKNNSCNCNCSNENNSSSFIFGIILGAIIGAIIAVVIYRNNKNKIIIELREKLSQFFNQFMEKAQDFKANISSEPKVTKPKTEKKAEPAKESKSEITAETEPETTKIKKKNPKTFVRPKK